ncbi:hypothetical protein JKF63_06203 [Porcisia hertigi]|uniref:Uncharacterized protein n=1 Tax=Porcisia hertigi TaxID=2761500 RepID=A0A836LIX2_9TRYP|nr:hypothetical protein JKF63_06203 [Porcisia hertigi]
MSKAGSSDASDAAATLLTVPSSDSHDGDRSSALTEREKKEFDELRWQNQLLKAENAVLQRKLEEELAQRRQPQLDQTHYSLEAKTCLEAIENIDSNAQVLALHDELHRLRKKCDIYAEAVEESRSYFFEMKRLYMEVLPHLRSSPGDASSHRASSS